MNAKQGNRTCSSLANPCLLAGMLRDKHIPEFHFPHGRVLAAPQQENHTSLAYVKTAGCLASPDHPQLDFRRQLVLQYAAAAVTISNCSGLRYSDMHGAYPIGSESAYAVA